MGYTQPEPLRGKHGTDGLECGEPSSWSVAWPSTGAIGVGFERSPTDPRHLILLMKDAEKFIAQATAS